MNNEQILMQVQVQMTKLEMSQKTLSEKTLITRGNVSKILNGTHNWTRDTMVKILKALELKELITLLK